MNTPAHMLIGAALCARPGTSLLFAAACAGAVLPDLSLYLLAGVSLTVLQIPPARVFGELYYSDAWQAVFAVDNSFLVWGVALALALWSQRNWAVAFCAAGLLHLALDFPLHHDDGRAHFWPLTNWIFESPLSYWDRRHGAGWVAPVEAAACVCAVIALLRRRLPLWAMITTVALLVAEFWVVRQWLFIFLV